VSLSRDFEVECVSRRSCERRMTDSIGALSRTFGKGRFTLTGFYNYFHNIPFPNVRLKAPIESVMRRSHDRRETHSTSKSRDYGTNVAQQ
jgi:hypothetical protein